MRPRLARLLAILVNDPARALIDEALLRELFREDGVSDRAVGERLRPGARLVSVGAVRVRAIGGRPPCFHELAIDPAVLARLESQRDTEIDRTGLTERVRATTPLEDLLVDRGRVQACLDALGAWG